MTRTGARSSRRTPGANARGAVLVQVAVAITALCGFSALAVDYGMLMVARGQAQAAADAGALAGATAVGFDDFGGLHYFTSVIQPTQAVARANLVLGAAPDVEDTDVVLDLAEIPGFPPSPDPNSKTGVKVSVYRNRDRGNPLPTFFGRLVGIGSQGVRASAAATVVPSNASDCVWPLAIPDLWTSATGGPSFIKYGPTGPPAPAASPDTYTPPSFTPPSTVTSGSGYYFFSFLDIDWPLSLTAPATGFSLPTGHSQFVAVQLPGSGGFTASLASCNTMPVTIGDVLTVEPTGSLGKLPAALAGAAARMAADPTASWNPTTLRMQDSCASAPTPCAAISPRIVVLPLFDLNRYELTRWSGGVPGATPEIEVVNFAGFFITQVTGSEIRGQLTTAPGRVISGRPMVGYRSAFLRTPVLRR